MQLTVRHLLPQELPEIRSWYEDAELARRLTYPTDEWYTAVSREGQESWVAVDETNTIVAKMQVDRDGDIGYIDLAVRPELRRRGFGSAALMAFIAGPGKAYSMLEGGFSQTTSQALLASVDADFVCWMNSTTMA